MKKTLTDINLLLLAIILPILSGNTQTLTSGHPGQKRVVTEAFALDTVMRIPEVKEANAYIRKNSKDGRLLYPMLYGEPDSLHPYYWVVVGEDNGMCFVTHFTFYVYTNGGRILYHDNFSGKTMDLNTWRRALRRKKS